MESISKLSVRRRLISEVIHVTQPWLLLSMAKRSLLVDVVPLDVNQSINYFLYCTFLQRKYLNCPGFVILISDKFSVLTFILFEQLKYLKSDI